MKEEAISKIIRTEPIAVEHGTYITRKVFQSLFNASVCYIQCKVWLNIWYFIAIKDDVINYFH